jgi:hypothetical protein
MVRTVLRRGQLKRLRMSLTVLCGHPGNIRYLRLLELIDQRYHDALIVRSKGGTGIIMLGVILDLLG